MPCIGCKPVKAGAPPVCILADEVGPLAVMVLPHPWKQDRQVVLPVNNDFRFMLCTAHSAPPGMLPTLVLTFALALSPS